MSNNFRSRSGLTGSANTVLLYKNNRLQSLSADDTDFKWAFFEPELRGLIVAYCWTFISACRNAKLLEITCHG